MVTLLGGKFKFPFGFEDHGENFKDASASLRDFRSKILSFLDQLAPESPSVACLRDFFTLLHVTNKAFAKLVTEIDYPVGEWGEKLTEKYLCYSLCMLDLLNVVDSSVSHLNHAKVLSFHAIQLLEQSPSSGRLKKIEPRSVDLGKAFMETRSSLGNDRPSSVKETAVLEALTVVKRIGFLALGLVLSGLCSDCKPYVNAREFVGGSEDLLIKRLDSVYGQELIRTNGVIPEVKEVNDASDRLSAAISTGSARAALKDRLLALENLIQTIEKQSNSLFSEVLATRNELLDRFQLSRHKKSKLGIIPS